MVAASAVAQAGDVMRTRAPAPCRWPAAGCRPAAHGGNGWPDLVRMWLASVPRSAYTGGCDHVLGGGDDRDLLPARLQRQAARGERAYLRACRQRGSGGIPRLPA